jgi:hypothetical protein
MLTSFVHPGLAEPRTKEEWRAYLDNPIPARPVMPSFADYRRLSESEREDFDEQRLDYHSALVIVRTEHMKQLHHHMHRRMRVNARQTPGARRGIVLDGPATIGKSTLVKIFAADVERRLRQRHPERFATHSEPYVVEGYIVDYTPIVYLNIPAQATPKDLSVLLADYLGHPHAAKATRSEITTAVLDAMRLCGTELVIIDDVHFLDLSAREGKVVNDHLKYLANHTAATFIYTGADLNTSGLFLEGTASARATQTSGRNSLHKMRPFAITSTEGQLEWASVIKAMEQALALHHHEPGSLTQLWRYLHERTGGSISGLSDLVRESAIEAILNGDEAITRKLMDTIEISEHAQHLYRRTRARHHPQTKAG